LEIELPNEMREKMKKIVIIERGKDAEFWGGHYGS
jgi:hypothetical protein